MRNVRGFTLLELLMGVMIFSLVIGSIYFTLRVGIESFHSGEESMQIYQSARIGMNRVAKDLRSAVSPESPWSNVAEEERNNRGRRNRIDREPIDNRPKESDIIFQGDAGQLTFVVETVGSRGGMPFDLMEVRYQVDEKNEILMRQEQKSIVSKRMMDWRASRLDEEVVDRSFFEENQRRLVTDRMVSWQGGRAVNETRYNEMLSEGPDSEAGKMEMMRSVKQIQFRYFDGEEWKDKWDSNELVSISGDEYIDYSADEYYDEEGELRRIGLPDAVEFTVTLSNDESLVLQTEIPARDIDELAYEDESSSNQNQTTRRQTRSN